MGKSIWKTTKLYSELSKRSGEHAQSMRNLLENPAMLDTVERILDSGGTTPKDFTLHDADHSFRVAEQMWELIADETKAVLTDYELGFLLLSAYLHDIGMSPDFDTVERHRTYLTTDNKAVLAEDEIQEFQKWIDNNDRINTIDIRKEKITDDSTANYVLMYYIRFKHNDWSGDYIKLKLLNFDLADFPDWKDDLVELCKSHHYGIENLIKDRFDPKPVGASHIHLRYLAMLLRTADVMENDPERTPDVILKHRNVGTSSVVYWLKDKRFNLTRDNNKFHFYARPERAYLHKAIVETADQIEAELILCDNVKNLKPLNSSRFGRVRDYEWKIKAIIDRDIAPKDGSYVYIQGGFRPKTDKILELLGGNQLYGDPIWAYRELIQNAFDAVKEKIAYQIINEDKNPEDFLPRLRELYTIKLTLEKRADGYWLICKDDGVGMTKDIIERYFLESGLSKRHEIKELERRCKEKGFALGRTGQFGIGVLSYFMIAEKIVVSTMREQITGYPAGDCVSWIFEINGVHDFGELIQSNKPVRGTEVALKLKADIENAIDEWDVKFSSFLKERITKSPCKIFYVSKITPANNVSTGPNWILRKEDVNNYITREFKGENWVHHRDSEILTLKERDRLRRIDETILSAIVEIRDIVDFIYDEGELTNGTYRIFIPYFKLSGGNSLYYMKDELNGTWKHLVTANIGYVWRYLRPISFSLRGIKTNAQFDEDEDQSDKINTWFNAYVEVDLDLIDQKNISVSRHYINLKDSHESIFSFIRIRIESLILHNKEKFVNVYSSLHPPSIRGEANEEFWCFSDKVPQWQKVIFPLIDESDGWIGSLGKSFTFQGTTLQRLGELEHLSRSTLTYSWADMLNLQNVLATLKSGDSQYNNCLVPVVTGYNNIKFKANINEWRTIPTPSSWEKVLLFEGSYVAHRSSYLCTGSELFQFYDASSFVSMTERGLDVSIADLHDKKECLSFLLSSILKYNRENWIALCENKSALISHAFSTLEVAEVCILTYERHVIRMDFGNSHKVDPGQIKSYIPAIDSLLPIVIHE